MENNTNTVANATNEMVDENTKKTVDYKAEYETMTAEFQRLKSALDKTNSENADYKRKERERMSDDDKRKLAEQERNEYIQKLEQTNRKFELEKTMLSKGFSQEETSLLVEKSHDAKAMAETMADILQARLENNAKQVKAQTLKTNTVIPIGSTQQPMGTIERLVQQMQEAASRGDNIMYSKYARELAEENAKKNK